MSQIETNADASGRLGRRKKRGLLPVVIMGAGRLGESLITLGSFSLSGFTVVGVFDKDPKRIGVRLVSSSCGTHIVEPTVKLASRVLAHNVRRGIIAVPPSTAQEAADELIGAGINVILSYAPTDVKVPNNVIFSRVDPAVQFAKMMSPVRLPWWNPSTTTSATPATDSSMKTAGLGLARLPCMWTAFLDGSTRVVINPVLLTLVANGQDEEQDNDADEEASTITASSCSEEETLGGDGPGFFEYIQSNQKFFLSQQKGTTGSAQRQVLVGLETQLEHAKESLMFRDDLVRTRGTLVYGPSGCGKSLLVKTLAQGLRDVNFYFVTGEEESLLNAFRSAARSTLSPSAAAVVVLENMDVLCRKRAFKSAFLSCTDNPKFNSVFVLATSNAPWDIDTSVLRHFERRMHVSLPDTDLRARVLQNHFAGCTVGEGLSFSDFAFVARLLEAYSTSDVVAVAKNAGLNALKNGSLLSRQDLIKSASIVRPTFCKEMLPLFASFSSRFGTHVEKHDSTVEKPTEKGVYLSMYS